MIFAWDDEKNIANQKKHGISFEEAAQVFEQEHEIAYDSEHSNHSEDRFLAYGFLERHGAVVVVFVEVLEDTIRIISAFKRG